jgi:hypothetical protein
VIRKFGGRDSDGSAVVGPADDAACAGGTGKEAAGSMIGETPEELPSN